jgi:hypothetical protein
MLKEAKLIYGIQEYDISYKNGLPKEFDFDNPEMCARRIFEVMSHESGSHTLKGCKVRIDKQGKIAALVGNGVRVTYQPVEILRFTTQDFLDSLFRSELIEIGNVLA